MFVEVAKALTDIQTLLSELELIESENKTEVFEKFILEPCPFCGKKETVVFNEDSKNAFIQCSLEDNGCGGRTAIFANRNDAVNAWNNRKRSPMVYTR